MSNNNSNTTLNFHNEKDLNDEIEVTEIKPNTSSLNIDKRKKVEYQTSDISIDMIVDENDSSKDIQNIKRSENKSRNVIVQKIIDFFNSLEKIYCPDDALENLKNYKYNSVDKSFISKYILKPYWEFCTRLFPLSMAPNLITLTGFGFMVLNLIFAIIFVPDLETPTSRWFYFSCSLGLWLYSTFDNIDGKQARRTKQSSPLGELFDHGCDSLNCAVGSIVEAAALGLGQTYYTYVFTMITIFTFFYSTWENYYTGRLYLGYVNGPTEGLILGTIIMMLSGIFGVEMWWKPLSYYLGSWVESIVTEKCKLIDFILLFMILFSFVTQIPITFYSVRKACRKNGKSFLSALTSTLPFLIYVSSTYLWVSSPNSVVLTDHQILFTLTIGIVFGRIATDIILAHVSGRPFPKFTALIFPIILGSFLVNIPSIFHCGLVLNPTGELIYLWVIFGISCVFYFHWAISVIRRFCNYLDINCLTIKHRVVY
jgi:ethanolaminephosphotransferase